MGSVRTFLTSFLISSFNFQIHMHVACGSDLVFKEFNVFQNKRLDSSSFVLGPITVRSRLRCATMCSENPACCAIDFDESSKICRLDSSCLPVMEYSINVRVMQKKIRDCSEYTTGTPSGIYTVQPTNHLSLQIFCQIDATGKWTVVQRRIDGTVGFLKSFEEYKDGFGDLNAEMWLGNTNLNILTNQRSYMLRLDLEDFSGETAYAEYSSFIVGDEASKFRLTIGGYSGTAGDSFVANNGYRFTTYDQDNDIFARGNCGSDWQGGWWYKWCGASNVNGPYMPEGSSGYQTVWHGWKGANQLKRVEIKIRPL